MTDRLVFAMLAVVLMAGAAAAQDRRQNQPDLCYFIN